MSAPTPGPWTWDEDGYELVGANGRKVIVQAIDSDPGEADANLIAAAPELLAAAKAMLEPGAHGWEQLRAAIAKAEAL